MKLYLVIYDGATEGYSTHVFLQGVYDSKVRAEEERVKLDDFLENNDGFASATIIEADLNVALPVRFEEKYLERAIRTDCCLACYYE